jgi:hypothetical protein
MSHKLVPLYIGDGEYYTRTDTDNVIAEKDAEIAKLKERSRWHRQKDKDIYFECGKHWGAEYIIKMKDGTTHLAYGGCDEGGDGSVSAFLHFLEDDDWDNDYEWEYEDIDMWYEIPDPTIIGNIKEADK